MKSSAGVAHQHYLQPLLSQVAVELFFLHRELHSVTHYALYEILVEH